MGDWDVIGLITETKYTQTVTDQQQLWQTSCSLSGLADQRIEKSVNQKYVSGRVNLGVNFGVNDTVSIQVCQAVMCKEMIVWKQRFVEVDNN